MIRREMENLLKDKFAGDDEGLLDLAQEALKEILDDIESKVKEIQYKLAIQSLNDLSQIPEAYDLAETLATELY